MVEDLLPEHRGPPFRRSGCFSLRHRDSKEQFVGPHRALSGQCARTGMAVEIAGVKDPDSKLAREITDLERGTELQLLFHYSSRVFYWGALTAAARSDIRCRIALCRCDNSRLVVEVSLQQSSVSALRWTRECRPQLPPRSRHFAAGHRHRVDRYCAAYRAGHSRVHASGDRAADRGS